VALELSYTLIDHNKSGDDFARYVDTGDSPQACYNVVIAATRFNVVLPRKICVKSV
jgi:hypothetical protein